MAYLGRELNGNNGIRNPFNAGKLKASSWPGSEFGERGIGEKNPTGIKTSSGTKISSPGLTIGEGGPDGISSGTTISSPGITMGEGDPGWISSDVGRIFSLAGSGASEGGPGG